jgi:hypothetical protein
MAGGNTDELCILVQAEIQALNACLLTENLWYVGIVGHCRANANKIFDFTIIGFHMKRKVHLIFDASLHQIRDGT